MISIKSFIFLSFLTFTLLCPTVLGYDNWWNESWKYRIPINLTELIGINRTFYVVEQNLTFPYDISDCWKEIRVTQCLEENNSCLEEIEVPVEILNGDNSTWCNIEFIANITEHSWRYFYVYYGNEEYQEKIYENYKKYYFSDLSYKPTDKNLRDISIVSDSEAYAVGGNDSSTVNGRAIKWNGIEWYQIPIIGGKSGSLGGVGFWSSEEGWATGDHEGYGTSVTDEIFIWNKTNQRWEKYSSPGWRALSDLEVLDKNFSIVGRSWGNILHWNGTDWKEKLSGFYYHTGRVDIISTTDVWATGIKDRTNDCGLTHWDGTVWTAQNCPTDEGYGTAIDCWSSSLCFAATSEGEIFKYDGNSWKTMQSPTNIGIYGIKFTDENEAWGCGENGILIRWDGKIWYVLDNITYKTLGSSGDSASIAGDGIDMLNSSYGWIIGEGGTILHRGSVSAQVGGVEEVPRRMKIKLEEDKRFYLEGEAKLEVEVSYENETLDLTKDDFDVFVDGKNLDFDLENLGDGEYNIVFSNLYENLGELGRFNLTVKVFYENDVTGENKTVFQFLKIPQESVIVSDKDWRNVIAASSTGRPVLVGEGFVNLRGLEGEFFVLGVDVGNFEGEAYRVNNRDSLQAMFLNENKKIKVGNAETGIFAARLANEMNRIVVFEGACGDCLDLSGKSLEEIENIFVEELGKTNYFVLANMNRENSLLAAQLSVHRKGFPVLVSLDNISYPGTNDTFDSGEIFNENNGAEETRERVKEKIEKFGKLEKDYAFGIMPKLAIVGTEKDVPYFVMWDMGLEDFVRELSGDDLWIKTDNFYGDVNEDGFMDCAVGRISRDLEKGSWQLLSIRNFEEKEKLEAGILAEYNHPGGFDLFAQGGSMLNGFAAHLNLREKYETERLVEKRFSAPETVEEELLEKIKEIILKDIDKKLFWVYSKLRFSQELLYILLERNWVDWEIPGVPHYLEEISLSKSIEFFENKDITFFLGPGDTNKIFLYEEDRDVYLDPYPGPELDLRNLEKTGFMFLDYSYSFNLDFPINSPGLIGNTGLLHDTASRDTIIQFTKRMGNGLGQALAESKNEVAKARMIGLGEQEGPKPKEKEYFEKVLLTDPALNLGDFYSEGYFSAEREGNYFYDSIEIRPEYDGEFTDYSSVLIEPNKPILPVYAKSMILPAGAKIREIKIDKNQRIVENVSLPVYRDEYYREENFSGIYPSEEWWENEREFLDGRKEIYFSVPVRYDSKERLIINDFTFKVEYDSDLEITDFYAIDITEGEEQNFYLTLQSKEERETEVFLRIYGETRDEISRKVSLNKGENDIKFSWNNTEKSGSYEAQAVVVSGDIVVGPRATSFDIMGKPNLLIQTAEMIVQVWSSFEERILSLTSQKAELNKTKQDVRVESWTENGKTVRRITTDDFVLIITESNEKRETNFTSVTGSIIIKENLGNREEIVQGNVKVREEFENAKKLLQEELR